MNGIVEGEWQKVAAVIYGDRIHVTQYNETRRGFYAGFSAALIILSEIPDDKIEASIEKLYDEIRDFATAVLEGEA